MNDASVGTFWGGRAEPAADDPNAPICKKEFLASALAGVGVGTWQLDVQTGLVTWDAVTSGLFGLEKQAVTVGALLPVHEDDQPDLWESLLRSSTTGEPHDMEFRGLHSDGSIRWLRALGKPFPADATNPRFVAGIAYDVTDRKLAEQNREEIERERRRVAAEAKWASEHDPLTGLANRRAFEAHLEMAIRRAMQNRGNVGLLLLDLDHFKHVNDTLGHAAGDHLLRVLAARLEQSVGGCDFVARLGGDEFAVILEADAGGLDLPAAGGAILQRLSEPTEYRGRAMSAGASIGGAIFPRDARALNELINNADTALYALKESGRGGTKMFHPKMREEAQLVSSQLSLARSAIIQESVEPHYQPKIDLCTGQVVGFEALLRWHHASRGVQHPSSIAEAFKDYELASRLGDLMQRSVFKDMRRWLDAGLPVGVVAINAAPVEFLRDNFAERVLARMQEQGIAPHMVEIEVTEQVFFDRGADFEGRALRVLSRAGVRIALDDFGTGYSSLTHLRDYPVDVVKIDRSFIDKVTVDPEVGAIVSAVIDLATSLNLTVVAEGIETEGQRRLLINKGCDLGQGHLFGPALDAYDVPHLLQGRQVKCLVA